MTKTFAEHQQAAAVQGHRELITFKSGNRSDQQMSDVCPHGLKIHDTNFDQKLHIHHVLLCHDNLG